MSRRNCLIRLFCVGGEIILQFIMKALRGHTPSSSKNLIKLQTCLSHDMGWSPGSELYYVSGNHPMLIAAWFAVLKVGGVAISSMPVLRERELIYMMDKAKVQIAISDIKLSEDIEKAQQNCSVCVILSILVTAIIPRKSNAGSIQRF